MSPVLAKRNYATHEESAVIVAIISASSSRSSSRSSRGQEGRNSGLTLPVHWRGEFRIPNCRDMASELVCGDDFWCNRHCKTSPVVLEGFWGQVWPKISRKLEKSEFRVANEPLSLGDQDSRNAMEPVDGSEFFAFAWDLTWDAFQGHAGRA